MILSNISYSNLLFGEVAVQNFCPFLNCYFIIAEFKSSLYILNTSPSSDMCCVNIFSPPGACIFVVLMVSFAK